MLKAWYKLDGDGTDSSGNGYDAISTAPIWADGKIGKCAEITSADSIFSISTSHNLDTSLQGNFTISFWLNPKEGFDGQLRGLASCGVQDTNTMLYLVIRATNRLSFCFFSNDFETTYSPIPGEWVHCTFVGDKDNYLQKLYINGKFHSSRTTTSWLELGSYPFYLGNYGGSVAKSLLDDFRIYDNALSDKEIKELAKANILHYKFDDFQEPTENIWSGGLVIYNGYGVPASLTNTGETFKGAAVYRLAMTVDDAHSSRLSHFQTTLQAYGVYGSCITFLANTKYAASIFWKPVNKFDTVFGGTASNIGDFTSTPTEQVGGGWNRYTQIRNGTATENKTGHVFFAFYSPSLALNETIYIDVCAPQIEKDKDYATPFVDGVRTGVIHDYSGYGNDAELALATTPQWAEDCKIGSGAYKFIHDNASRICVGGYDSGIEDIKDTSEFTISLWAKGPYNSSDYTYIFHKGISSFIGDSFVYIGTSSNGKIIFSVNGNYPLGTTSTVLSSTDYQHLVLTYKNGEVNGYCNNILIKSYTTSLTNTTEGAISSLGGSYFSNSARAFDGYLDDVRIYATALSADDIKELYQTRASLDNKGTFSTFEIIENEEKDINGLIIAEGEYITSSFLVNEE